MASTQQITANRSNAQRSTGPRDTSRTKLNGTQHGLTSRRTVIAGESQAEYDTFCGALMTELGPGSETERLLAERITAAAWRLRRFTRMEAAFFNNRIEAYLENNPEHDPDAALANLFTDPAEAQRMRLFLRYQTAVQSEYDRAVRLLDKARKERAQRDLQRAALADAEASAASETTFAAQTSANQPCGEEYESASGSIGFASYNPHDASVEDKGDTTHGQRAAARAAA